MPHQRIRPLRFISVLSFAYGCLATCANAADTVKLFNIPAQPLNAAIVELAAESHVSIGGVSLERCGKRSAPVLGPLRPQDALKALLRGTNCTATRIDERTFLLVVAPEKPMLATHAKPDMLASPPPQMTSVIVTANRRPQLAGDAASAISLISAAQLANAGESLSNVASQVPGLTLTNLGSGRDKILLRGISDGIFTGRTQSTVGLYLDDTPITFNAPDPDLLLVDMARIEVLRGPQGALYGEGSISGVVRLVMNRPDLETFEGSFDAGLASTDNGAPSSRQTLMINGPLISGRLAVRTVLYNDQAGGYIHDLGLAKTNANAVHRYGGRFSARWQINRHWSAMASYVTQEINARNSQYVAGVLGPYVRNVTIAEPHDNDFSDTSLSVEGQTRLGMLRVSVNHLHHRIQSRYDASALASALSAPPAGALIYDENQKVELTTEDLSLVSPSDQRLRWLAGLFASRSSEDFKPELNAISSSAPLYTEGRHDGVDTLAAFGEISYDLTPELTLTGGLRATESHHTLFSQVTNGTVTQTLTDHIGNTHLSHQIVLRYRPNDHLMVYAQSAEGYRDSGFNTTRLAQSPTVPGRYTGDELNSYEAGLKLNLPDHHLHLTAAVFRVFWRDIQSDQLQSTGLPVTVNIGNGENTGLELEAEWRPIDSLILHGAALINEPRLTQPNPLYATAEDSGLPFIARHSYSLSADWQKRLKPAQLDTYATWSYRGVSHLNFGALQTIEMGGYSQLDIGTRLSLNRLHYSLRIDNLTDVRGNSFAYGNPFSLGVTGQTTPLRPRTLWVSLGVSF